MLNFLRKRTSIFDPVNAPAFHLCLNGMPNAVVYDDYFPRINWNVIHKTIKDLQVEDHLHEQWSSLSAQWVRRLSDHLGAPYRVFETSNFVLLSSQSRIVADSLLATAETAYARLEDFYKSDTNERGLGKRVILHFAKMPPYYDYISYYYPQKSKQKEHATSGGIHIQSGYSHVVINGPTGSVRTLVHELAHNLVRTRKLPQWVNEGFAQFAEEMVAGDRQPNKDARRRRELHIRYWSWFGIQHFWSGQAFTKPSSQSLSYELSKLCMESLWSQYRDRERLAGFLKTAEKEDFGQAAFRSIFNRSLGDLAAELLGEGDWEPDPPS